MAMMAMMMMMMPLQLWCHGDAGVVDVDVTTLAKGLAGLGGDG
jgi:hypothetical protein